MSAWTQRILIVSLASLAVWLIGSPGASLQSQTPGNLGPAAGDDLQVISSMLTTGTQQVVVVQPKSTTMAVYHIDPAQGKIQLKSVRNLAWDLRMEHFNGQNPLPSELREVEP